MLKDTAIWFTICGNYPFAGKTILKSWWRDIRSCLYGTHIFSCTFLLEGFSAFLLCCFVTYFTLHVFRFGSCTCHIAISIIFPIYCTALNVDILSAIETRRRLCKMKLPVLSFFTTLWTREITLLLKKTLYAAYRENATYAKIIRRNSFLFGIFIFPFFFSPQVTIVWFASIFCERTLVYITRTTGYSSQRGMPVPNRQLL